MARLTPEQLFETHRMIQLDEVQALPGNPNEGHEESLRGSVEEFGWFDGIVVHEGVIIAGHGRVRQATADGEAALPGYDLSGYEIDDARKMAMAIAHNQTNRLGKDDSRRLLDAIESMPEGLVTPLSIDVEHLRLKVEEIESAKEEPPAPSDDASEALGIPSDPVTQPGWVWEWPDGHRIVCGDCRQESEVASALNGRKIDLGFTSPPYADRREYDEATSFEPIPPGQYVEWFKPVADNVNSELSDTGSWFVNIKAASDGLDSEIYVLDLVAAHVREWGWHWVTEFCWQRPGMPGLPRRRFKNQFEPVFHFAKQDGYKFRPKGVASLTDVRSDNVMLSLDTVQGTGAGAVVASEDGFVYPGNRLPMFMGSHEALGHPAAFPVGLPEFFIKAYTDRDDVVFDPFLGSGSSLVAAHRTNRVAVGMELSPGYCDIAAKRMQIETGVAPTGPDGKQWDFLDGA